MLYRLPELLDADSKRPVFIPEGEKDVERLRSLGLVATTNVGGAGKWRSEYTEVLKDRRVVLLPDNDPSGWDSCKNIASELLGIAAWIKIVELPGLPDKGDVSDWLDSDGTKKKLVTTVCNTPEEPDNDTTGQRDNGTGKALGINPSGQRNTQQDEPLSRCVMGSVGSFPVKAFPKTLQRYIRSIAEALPCPPDFPGAMLLPVLSACIGRKRCIEITSSWTEHPSCGL